MSDDTELLGDISVEEEKPKRRRGRPPGSGTGAKRGPAGLQDDLKQAHQGMSLVLIAATNPGVLGNRQVVDVLEEQSAKWAAAAMAVARQDERVMASLVWAMQSGVWLGFVTATAGSVVTVATLTGRFAVPIGPVQFLQPKLAQLMVQQAPPEHAAAANGAGAETPVAE